jgi:hypothetical protein
MAASADEPVDARDRFEVVGARSGHLAWQPVQRQTSDHDLP